MNDLINFNKMITPTIIKIIFWIGIVFFVLSGLFTMFDGGFSVILGLLVIVIGPLFVRIYCELLIVMFKMHESLNEINRKMNQ